MLDNNLKTQLKAYLEKLRRPIDITVFVDDSETSQEMRSMLKDIQPLSDKITLTEKRDASERTPSFRITHAGGGQGATFAGMPMGHEFTSLVLALLHVGGHPPKVESAVLDQVAGLPGPLHFETYISLSCHNCPEVVQALNTMAALNPNVSSVMIDGMVFQEEVNARKVMAVPAIFLNGEPFGQGRMTLEEILAKVDTGAGARAAEALAAKAPYDVLIVGGGPAGAAAAIYAARKGIRTGVVAERFGGQVLDTLAIENLISVKETDGPKLAAALEQNVKALGVDVMNLQRVQDIIPGEMIEVKLESGASLKGRTVILAPGASWREMGVPGEREYRGKGVAYCPHCDGPLFKGKRVAVVGGGNSAVEAAIDLAGIVAQVTIMIRGDELRADKVLREKMLKLPNVTFLKQVHFHEITGEDGKVNGLVYQAGDDQAMQRLDIEGVFVQIGLTPNTAWLGDRVALNEWGEIVVDHRGCTSVPGVFAAGDATNAYFKQIIIAMGDGAKASLSAFEHLMRS